MTGRETSAEIDATAAEWAVRVDSAPLEPGEQATLDAWLIGDTRRLGAFARARAMLMHAGRTKALGGDFDPDAYLGAEAGFNGSTVIEEVEQPVLALPVQRRALLIGGTGAVAAGLLAAFGFSWQAAAQTYSTKRGEIRLVPLADGSTMTLNTASTARVKFSAKERRVDLIEGEALFDVMKNPARPFVVQAGDTLVRAIGTSFTVRRLSERPVQVLVRQGVVEVDGPTTIASAPIRVAANNRVVLSEAQPVAVTPVASMEVSRELAWREGMLSFEDLPLRDAAAEFARYSDTHIIFEDPTIGGETVTGLFAANNPAGFAQSVALSLGLRAQNRPDGVRLTRRG